MLEDGKRRSIHQLKRNAIDSIKTLYDLSAGELRGQTTNEKSCSSSTTQTSPWMRHQEEKRRQESRVLGRKTTKATLSR